ERDAAGNTAEENVGPTPSPTGAGAIAERTDERVRRPVIEFGETHECAGGPGRDPDVLDQVAEQQHRGCGVHRRGGEAPHAPAKDERQRQARCRRAEERRGRLERNVYLRAEATYRANAGCGFVTLKPAS